MTTIPINLAALKNLSLLHFEITLHNGPQDDPFSGFLTLLGTIKLRNNLKSIRLGINYDNYHDALASLKGYGGWPRLSNLLGRFQKLSDLEIMLCLWASSPAKRPQTFKKILEGEVRQALATTRTDREIILDVVVFTWPQIGSGAFPYLVAI